MHCAASRKSACNTAPLGTSHGIHGHALGGTLASLADWGRWKDLKQARHYAKAPADWSLPEFLSLPYPESFTGFPSRDMGGVSIRTKDVWP